MAMSVVPISPLLGPSSSSGLILEESIEGLDQRCSTGEIAGFRNKQRTVATLGIIRSAHPSSSATFGLVLSCSSSGYSGRAGFVAVSATNQKQHRTTILDLDVDDNFEVDDDDDENGEATEFADMEEWNKNKPAGFGVKVYDTSLEDRLLAEIDAGKKAAAEVAHAAKKKDTKLLKAMAKQDAPPQGVEVFVGNLPRKRNVDRDLRAAFRSALGLLHIRPIVDGNEKTREPLCKGLAFLTFASDNEAKDFIRRYNGLEVKFGKMEKKLVCELAALNSPFRKDVSQKRGTDSPRLKIRDKDPSSSSPPASSSSRVAVGLEEARELSVAAQSKSSGKSSVLRSEDLQGEDKDIDSLDVSEVDLIQLEQEIWAGLEDEDDFELDRALEGDSEEDLNALLNEEKVMDLEAQNDKAQNREDLVQLDILAFDAIHVRKSVQDVRLEDEDQKADIQEAESSRGRGFGFTPDDAAGDKDKRIQELESKLKELQVQIEKTKTKTKTSQSEDNIEALEKRLLARARSASENSRKNSTAKKGTGSQKPSKGKSLSQRNPSRPKLGSASRLKNKSKQIYTGVLSKYSPLAKEVAL